MKDVNNLDGRNTNGMDTSGLNAETFGVSDSFDVQRESNIDAYAASWSNEGAHTVPGYNDIEPESIKKEGSGLEIATLILGLLAIFMCCCNGLFGVAGLIVGIVAITQGKRSGMTIAGIVCSVVGLVFGFIILIMSFSDSGQKMQDAFFGGEEQEYSVASNGDTDINGDDTDSSEMEEYEELPVTSHEGSVTISDEEASQIVIDGNKIVLPCKLSDVLECYEVSSYSEECLSGGLEPYSTEMIYLAKNGEENGVYVAVDNDTETTIGDIKDAQVNSISIDDSGAAPIGTASVFRNISIGMSSAQVEESIKDIKYNKSEMSGYVFYNIFVGDKDRYSVSLMLSDDKVINISVYYSNY